MARRRRKTAGNLGSRVTRARYIPISRSMPRVREYDLIRRDTFKPFHKQFFVIKQPLEGRTYETRSRFLQDRPRNIPWLISERIARPYSSIYARSVCSRRFSRRLVLFARGVAGRNKRNSHGSGPAGRRYRRNTTSLLRCR